MFFKTGSTQYPHSFITCLLTTYCARHPVPAYLGLMGWLDNYHQHLLSTNYMLALGEAPRAENLLQSSQKSTCQVLLTFQFYR